MSKWRPAELNCLYVIPDIHGQVSLLNKVLKRILPLRKSDGGQDQLIFLGDYVDRHADSHLVLDKIIELKKKYPTQVQCIRGNHESMMQENCKSGNDPVLNDIFRVWLNNGGSLTLIGYMDRVGKASNPFLLPRNRVKDYVPKEHIEFLENDLIDYYCYKDFIFVHGGMNPNIALEAHSIDTLHWDRSLVRNILKHIGYAKSPGLIRRHGIEEQKEPEFVIDWEKTIITGHNGGVTGGKPIIADRYMMLDAGAPKRLLVAELNSMEAFMAYPDKDRLVKYPLNETTRETLMNPEETR